MKALALLAVAGVLAAPAAHAQVFDHLKCHKMKDPLKLKATVDLDAVQAQFSATGCLISKAKLFCVPATKSNVQPPEAAPLVVDGQELENDFICYSAKCPDTPPDTAVTDQFGSRTQVRYKSSFICAPAIEGAVTTTTTSPGGTTTTTSGTTCGTSGHPECNGPCSLPGDVCGDIGGGNCGCFAGAPACGSFQGAPTCAGTCPGATPFCKTVSGSCTCSATP
ncbi:MAG TPA: hypothetical protein VKA21_10225 [Candidatus Binatia bacterium]|nr:hypothetical protein [Candidatus Binatia bacterium]